MESIKSKYCELLLAPHNGLPKDLEVVTLDGIKCRLEYQVGWNNEGGQYDHELDEICLHLYKYPFSSIKTIWSKRLGFISDYWHLVKLIKL